MQGCSVSAWVPVSQIFVFFADDTNNDGKPVKVGVNVIKTFAQRMESESVTRAIMVSQAALTPFAKQCVAELVHKRHIEPVRPGQLICTPAFPPGLGHHPEFSQCLVPLGLTPFDQGGLYGCDHA